MKAIVNAKIITDNSIIENHALLFSGIIKKIIPLEELLFHENLEVFDAKGNFLSAGFIDVHVHGSAGADTMDEAGDAIGKIGKSLVKTGVTAFLPTTMTLPFAQIHRALENIRRAMKNTAPCGAVPLGCHLEGPFINPAYHGAQDEAYILTPDYQLIAPFADTIKIVTMAPEMPGGGSFIRECRKNDIIVSIGHSAATYEEAAAAIAAGAAHITHTFNAMTPLNHRLPGIIGAALDSGGVTCELITDNIHVHPALQRLLFAAKGRAGIILVSDAMRGGLLGDGEHDWGGQKVLVKGGAARLENGTLAGSVLAVNQAIYNFMVNTKTDLPTAVRLATLNPARLLGAEKTKGSVAVGKDADLTIFDNKIEISATIVGGNLVYVKEFLKTSKHRRAVRNYTP